MSCPFNSKKIRPEIRKTLNTYINSKGVFIPDDVDIVFKAICNNFFKGNDSKYELPNTEEKKDFVKTYLDLCQNLVKARSGGLTLDSQIYSVSNFVQKFNDIIDEEERVEMPSPSPTSHEVLEAPVENLNISEYTDKFLYDAYGNATSARRNAEQEVKTYICDCLFLDRGFTKDLSLNSTRTFDNINQNIRNYHQLLFDRILNFLKKCDDVIIPENTNMYERIGNGDHVSTGVYEKLLPIMKQKFSRDFFTSDVLTKYEQSNNVYDKQRLNAYNAFVFLNNFDKYMINIFGDTIKIQNKGFRDGSNKYSISGKTTGITDTYRKDDNFDIEKEMDVVAKLIIETTPLCDINGEVIKGKYLNFNDFAFISSFLKLHSTDKEFKTTFFDERTIERTRGLSRKTKDFVKNKSLSYLLTSLRIDFQKTMPAIAELYIAGKLQVLTTTLNKEQKEKLDTFMYQFFNPSNDKSIYKLVNFLDSSQVYSNLCFTADSIFSNILTQTFQDKDGKMYSRLMIDLAEYNETVKIKKDINQINSPLLQPADIETKFREEYNLVNTETGKKLDKANLVFEIDLPGKSGYSKTRKLRITVNKKSDIATIETVYPNKKTYSEIPRDAVDVIKKLSDSVLGTTFSKDNDLWNNFINKDNYTNSSTKLLKYIGRVLGRIYVSNTKLKGKSYRGQITALQHYYAKEIFDKLGFDRNTSQINLFGSEEDNNVISDLAKARLETLGLTISASIKDSEKKSQSLRSLSKLVSSYNIGWELQEMSQFSATTSLDLLRNPDLHKGVEIANELYSKQENKSKKTVEMTPAEFSTQNFLIDFLPALFETDDKRSNSNGLARFIASVNSDKNTVDKLVENLNAKFKDAKGDDVSYIAAEDYQLHYNIRKNLGSYYSNMLTKIYEDFDKLRDYIPTFLSKLGFKEDVINSIDFKIQELQGFDYINDFQKLKDLIIHINKVGSLIPDFKQFTERDFIEKLTFNYNQENPSNIIQLVQNVHINYKGNNIGKASNTILAQVYRFGYNPSIINSDGTIKTNSYITDFYNSDVANSRNWSTLEQFLEMRQLEMIGAILSNNTQYNTSILSENVKDRLTKQYGSWLDQSGKLIIAKINGQNITSKADFDRIFGPQENYKLTLQTYFGTGNVEINPLLIKNNLLHYLFTQQWMFSTVGSFVAHPNKVNISENLEAQTLVEKYPWMYEMFEESSQFNAQSKRNVSFTAQMQQFQLNHLYGINSKYKITTCEDLIKYVDVLTSKQNKIKPFDGATLVDPFTMYLENKSLGMSGDEVGLTKKPFIHFKNPEVGNGGIIKTATFALNNNAMRNSPELALNLMYKMSGRQWTDENNKPLTDFNILESDLIPGKSLVPENIYFTKNGKFYEITGIEYTGSNTYTRYIQEVDINGKSKKGVDLKPEPDIIVNSNVQAWELFGGLYSMELKSGKLQWSEKSIKAVVDCMNHKGFKKSDEIKTQSDFYQPMKHSQINYIVTDGAIKQGAANVNKNNVYTDYSELQYQEIELLQGGIQLDKEHHADLSEVSVPTQVIAACAGLGHSFLNAETLYQGVATIAEVALDQILVAAKTQMDPNSKEKFIDSCMEIIIKNLANASTQNFGTYLAQSIVDTIKTIKNGQNEWARRGFPISDNTVFNRAINSLANYMTKNAIKLKMPGTLSIMTPSHKMTPIFGDRQFGDFIDPLREIRTAQHKYYDSKPIYSNDEKGVFGSVADVNVDYTYKFDVTEPVGFKINENRLYNITYNGVIYKDISVRQSETFKLYDGQAKFEGSIEQILQEMAYYKAIIEKFKKLRPKLRTETDYEYIVRINQEAYDEFNYIRGLGFRTQVYHKTVTLGKTDDTHINYNDLRDKVYSKRVTKITEYIMNGRDLGSYNARFEGSVTLDNGQLLTGKFSIYDLESVQALHSLDKTDPSYKDAEKQMKRDLKILSKVSIDSEKKMNEFLEEYNRGKTDINLLLDKLRNYVALQIEYEFVQLIRDDLSFEQNINNLKNSICGNYVNIKQGNRILKLKVDRSTIEHQDYEVIMPNTYQSIFDIKEGTSVAQIINNPNYFIEQNIEKQKSKFDKDKYQIELKRSNGKHVYLAIDNQFNKQGLVDVTNAVYQGKDDMDVKFRLDENSHDKMYEIKDGVKIYSDENGNEIISINTVTDDKGNIVVDPENLKYYLNKFSASKVLLSESCKNLSEKLKESILDGIYESKHDNTFIRPYLNDPENIEQYIERQNKIFTLTKDDLIKAKELLKKQGLSQQEQKDLNQILKHPDYIDGKERYNTFKEYLHVIAARIPAQSMQSFMAMKVVGFSKGDRNTAYVSDHQIFLQGSDFDIDSVTILTYDINDEGKLDLWSPFAVISTAKGTEISKTLPLPTNQKLEITENKEFISTDKQQLKEGTVDECKQFFDKYGSLLLYKIENGKLKNIKFKVPKLSRQSEKHLQNIKELLEESIVYYPKRKRNQTILNEIKEYIELQSNTKLTEFTEDDLFKLFDQFINIINEHNTYLSNKQYVDNSKLHRIINNSNLNSMYQIITDTSNLSQSMTSVDAVTDGVKDIAKQAKEAINELLTGAGNIESMGEGIHQNYTGKDCIAKSASTIKTYFKLTHFFNKILNSNDSDLQDYLIINDKVLKACGKYIPQLANIRARDPLHIVNNEALKRCLYAAEHGSQDDFALELSALLGLSADNAKELVLAKINAGIDLIGLYLYGISIGFNIRQLSEVLMSNTAKVLQQAMKENSFLGYKQKTIDKIFDHFSFGTNTDFNKFNVIVKADGENTLSGDSLFSPVVNVFYELSKKVDYSARTNDRFGESVNPLQELVNNIKDFKNNATNDVSIKDMGLALIQLVKGTDLNSFLNECKNVRQTVNNIYANSTQGKTLANQLIDYIETFATQYNNINQDDFNALRILSIGSSSMQQIGAIVGLNQGIPGDLSGFIKKIETIENYIVDQKKLQYKLINGYDLSDKQLRIINKKIKDRHGENLELKKLDLFKFITDENYRQTKIRSAEYNKVNFNLLALINTLPDIKKYVEMLFIIDSSMQTKSVRYKFIRNQFDNYKKEYKLNKDDTVNNMSKFIQSIFIREYLKNIPFSFKTSKVFVSGEKKETNIPLTVKLDSLDGIATFKLWMETEVIPDLKKKCSDNLFIQNLKGSSRNNTLSGNEILVYSLPVNMITKEGSNEDIVFKRLLNSFNALNVKINGIPVQQLFFYYALTAFEWKQSSNSLMNLFKDGIDKDYIKNYFDFISHLDGIDDISQLLLSYKDDVKYYMSSKNRFKDPNAKYIYCFNKDSGKNEFWKKQERSNDDNNDYNNDIEEFIDDFENQEEFTVPGYEIYSIKDPNYYILGNTISPETNIIKSNNLEIENENYEVYRDESGKINQVFFNKKEITDDLKTLQVIKVTDSGEEIDWNLFNDMNNKENICII